MIDQILAQVRPGRTDRDPVTTFSKRPSTLTWQCRAFSINLMVSSFHQDHTQADMQRTCSRSSNPYDVSRPRAETANPELYEIDYGRTRPGFADHGLWLAGSSLEDSSARLESPGGRVISGD